MNLSNAQWINVFRHSLPWINRTKLRKGDCGRVSIIGGSEEYTGAPYFAAMSSLRSGADLCHVFCFRSAATGIRCMSPEIIVHAVLDDCNRARESSHSNWIERCTRMDVIVLGPGLGRDISAISRWILPLIDALSSHIRPLIVDADGLWLICQLCSPQNTNENESIDRSQFLQRIRALPCCIFTPNHNEFRRLYEVFVGDKDARDLAIDESAVKRLVTVLGPQALLVVKDEWDFIACGGTVVVCDASGCPRRCGGQGDLLAGVLATFISWTVANCSEDGKLSTEVRIAAAYVACALIRSASCEAFEIYGRGMVASDILKYIHCAFTKITS